jgi:hypothetical protein
MDLWMPVVLIALGALYLAERLRERRSGPQSRSITCPVTGLLAAIEVDAMLERRDPEHAVTSCSLWPRRDCRRACVRAGHAR